MRKRAFKIETDVEIQFCFNINRFIELKFQKNKRNLLNSTVKNSIEKHSETL